MTTERENACFRQRFENVRPETPWRKAVGKRLGRRGSADGCLEWLSVGEEERLLLLRARKAKDHYGQKCDPDEFRCVEGETQKQNAQHHGRQGLEVGEKRRGGSRDVGETPQVAPEGGDRPDGGDVEVEGRRDEIPFHGGDVRRIGDAEDCAAQRHAPAHDDPDR